MSNCRIIKLLEAFASAWNRHDLEALLSMVTEDCVFETAAGEKACGKRFRGKDELRIAFPIAWQTWSDARWDDAAHFACGARAVSEWTFRGTDITGKSIEVRGVDVFLIRDGKIARKDTYRKNRINN